MFTNVWKSKYPVVVFSIVALFTMGIGIKMFIERGIFYFLYISDILFILTRDPLLGGGI